MKHEIAIPSIAVGGDMEIKPSDLLVGGVASAQASESADVWPKFGMRYEMRCDTGRSALKLALLDWWAKRATSSESCVWIPTYICSTVTAAVAELGIRIKFYSDIPGQDSLREAPTPAPQDLVIIVHYFGWINRAALAWIDSLAGRQWTLLEDCVQAPYSGEVGTRGEYAIASLRKWWACPDGAIVTSTEELKSYALDPPSEAFVSRRIAAKLLRIDSRWEDAYLAWTDQSEDMLANESVRAVSWMAGRILSGVDRVAATDARRRNWESLFESLASHEHVHTLYSQLSAAEVPLVFPVTVGNGQRDALLVYLRKRRVYCPVHWRGKFAGSPQEQSMSRNCMSIPLDQRYSATHMHYVAGCINDFFRGIN